MDERIAHYLKILDFYLEVGEIDRQTYDNAKTWLTEKQYGDFHEGVMDLIRPTPLIDAFYQIIPFGTGGRRGTVGVGSNRMNTRTVGESAQGLAATIREQDADGSLAARGVVVAHDVRLSSEEFTRITASVLAANGVKVFLFDGPRSTPLLSFAVRYLNCIAGVVVTASHNPPSDNGFKAYWEDGGQVVAPHDKAILEQVKKVEQIEAMDLEAAKSKGLVETLDDRIDRAYFEMVKRDYVVCDERKATIVFSPLHGTGLTVVPPALKAVGFTDVHMPPEQIKMDGSFPTVPKNYPNPEMPEAMQQAVLLGKQVGADIVTASDPDADRLGVFVPDGTGEFVYLTGNTFGAMLVDFVLERLHEQNILPEKAYVLTTMVSSRSIRKICEAYGVDVVDDLLVGFKNIAYEILRREGEGIPGEAMVFSFEESIGYMAGHLVRDKDSGAAAVVGAQMTAWCKAQGMTLLDRLHQMQEKYGYFKEEQFSVFLKGEAGAEQMSYLMDQFRTNPPKEIAGFKVHAIVDRQTAKRTVTATGESENISPITSNVLVFELSADGLTRVSIRPSGTEPKIKHYIAHWGELKEKATVDQTAADLIDAVRKMEQEILAAG